MNFLDALAWPVAIITSPPFLMLILVLLSIFIWVKVVPEIYHWIDPFWWMVGDQERASFRYRFLTVLAPVTAGAAGALWTWLAVAVALVIIDNSPLIFVWG